MHLSETGAPPLSSVVPRLWKYRACAIPGPIQKMILTTSLLTGAACASTGDFPGPPGPVEGQMRTAAGSMAHMCAFPRRHPSKRRLKPANLRTHHPSTLYAGWRGGTSPPRSHGTVRDSLPSYGSSRPATYPRQYPDWPSSIHGAALARVAGSCGLALPKRLLPSLVGQ